jgi:hypothetical protein
MYLYRTNDNPPTESLVDLIDTAQEKVRNGEREIVVIHRAERHGSAKVLLYQSYCVVEAFMKNGKRRVASPRFLIEECSENE